jgi:ribosomal protein S18 acetylase RimI-like enzyme
MPAASPYHGAAGPGGGIGRHYGLKSHCPSGRAGSNPAPGMTIRRAAVADARAIAEVHVASWLAAYRGIVPDEWLDRLDVNTRTAQWTEWLSGGETRTLLAERDGRVDGFVTVRLETGDVAALYVAPERMRRGIGRALMRAAHEELETDVAYLWVFAANQVAIAFYEAEGYALDGERMLHDAGVEAVRMQRPLT